jgi:hypothetical protein
MSPWHLRDQTLAARRAPVATGQVGLRAGLVDEDEMPGVQLALGRMPGATVTGDIFAVLLGGVL